MVRDIVGGLNAGSTANASDIPEMERRSMSLAEREQCGLDDFWGLVANQAEQAKATAAMAMEDDRSEAVRAGIKKEERFALWENEDLRIRETKRVVKANLEEAARTEYLELFYSQPSADFTINYRWPTRASLQQTLGYQQPGPEVDDNTTLSATFRGGGSSYVSSHRSGGHSLIEPAVSTTQSVATTSTSTGESSSTRQFHNFRGKKAHQIIPVRDCFVPPRHIAEPITSTWSLSVDASVPCAPSHGAARPATHPATAGLPRAVRLPPMAETTRGGRPFAPVAGLNVIGGGKGQWSKKQLLTPKPGAPGQPLMASFQRKFDVKHEAWSREAEEHAEERRFEEQWRAEDLLRERRGLDGAGGVGGGSGGGSGRDAACKPKRGDMFESAVEKGRRELGDARRPRRTRRRGWRDGDYCDEGSVAELIPEREEELLTQMFQMLDARDRGEVQLDEVLFHMTENAQVKAVLKQVSLWIMTKTRRWEWAEELFDAQPGRTLTLPSLLEFSRKFHRQNGMQRRHLRLAGARRELDAARRDFRSRRLLPADLDEGQEVEALFLKGFEWYRAWIVKCHANDTFDVRFTRPSTPSNDESPRRGVAEKTEEWQLNVETPSLESGSEDLWGSDGESCTTAAAEEQWKTTCERVAQFIGIPPDLGETEGELLEKAFDTVFRLASTKSGTPPASGSRDEFQMLEEARSGGGSGNGTVIGDGNRGREQTGGANRQQDFMKMTPGIGGGSGSGGSGGRGGSGGGGSGGHDGGSGGRGGGSGGGISGGGGSGGGGSRGGGGSIDVPRVPATEITRLLLAGDLDEYRQASPALSAACVYQDFARGLEDVAKGRREGSASSVNCCHDGDNFTGPDKARGDGANAGAGARGGEPGWVSKEEFCDYFEAVTDLVDLNGLSLTQPARRQCSTAA